MLTQDEIAYDLGIILPSELKDILPKFYTGKRPKAGWGTRIDLKRFSINSFFIKRKYPLKEKHYYADSFTSLESFKEFINKNIKSKNDQIVIFNFPYLYDKKGAWGHASLIENIKNSYTFLRDPSPKAKNLKKVLTEKLFDSIINHDKGGIWVISSK